MSSLKCCLLLLVLLGNPVSGQFGSRPTEIKIGFLKHSSLVNEEEAFRYAIDVINENKTVLPQTKLVGVIVDFGPPESSPSKIIRAVLDLVNRGVSAIVGPYRSSRSQLASYILNELKIPMITPSATDPFLRNPEWSKYMIHMQPLDEFQSKALLDLAKSMDWSSVALVSSMDSYGINGLATFQKLSNERKIKIAANEMIPLTEDLEQIDVSSQVLNLKRSEARIIIMNVHSGYAAPILNTAQQMGIVGPDYAWIVTDATVKDAEALLNSTTGRFEGYTQGLIGFMSSVCCSQTSQDFLKKWHNDAKGVTSDGSWARASWGANSASMQLQSRASLTYDSVWVFGNALHRIIYTDNHPFKQPPKVDFWSDPVLSYSAGTMFLNYILDLCFHTTHRAFYWRQGVGTPMIPLTEDLEQIDVSSQVLNLKRSEARIIIMNVHSGYAAPILNTAQQMGIVGPDYAWIVTDATVKDAVNPFLRNPEWSKYMIHMQPLDEFQSKALLDLAKSMDWSSVALVSSMDSYGINGLATFQKLSNERKIKIAANEMIPLTEDLEQIDVSSQVLNLKRSEARIIIMNVHSGYAAPILNTAQQMGIVGPDYAWIVTDATVKDAEALLNSTTGRFEGYTQGLIGFMSSVCCSQTSQDFLKKWHNDAKGVTSDGSWARASWGANSASMQLQSRASLTYDSVWVFGNALHRIIYTDNHPFKQPPKVDFWSDPVLSYSAGTMFLNYILDGTDFEGLTGKIQFDRTTGGPKKKVYDLVNFRDSDIVRVGQWRPNFGLQMNASEKIVWNGNSNKRPTSTLRTLKGTKLRLGIANESPFMMIDEECIATKGKDVKECYTGLCAELVDMLAQQLKFEYEYVLSEDGKFGSPTANGSWNGLIKMLLDNVSSCQCYSYHDNRCYHGNRFHITQSFHNNSINCKTALCVAGKPRSPTLCQAMLTTNITFQKIDVATMNFAMNKARESAIDFSMPFINTGLVMTTKIKESKGDPFFWTKPFDLDLWYAILAFALLMVLLIWLYDHMSPFGFYGRRMHAALRCSCKSCEAFRCNKEASGEGSDGEEECLFESRLADPSENNEELMNIGNSLWMIAACLFSIGPVEGVPRNMSGRVILAMWWFMILIVTAMYTANLAAFLTVTRMESGISSITELVNQNTVKWGTVAGTNAEIMLGSASSPELAMVYQRMERVDHVQEGFRRAREEEYIFFYGGAIVAFEANSQPCNLQIIGEQLFSFGYAFAFPPQSYYLETFNTALLNLSGTNELDQLWKRWSKGDCAAKASTSTSSSLNLANIYGLCYTFFVVIAISAGILIGEVLFESVMDMKRFKTGFCDALKYRLIYIWKRPDYDTLKNKSSRCSDSERASKQQLLEYKPGETNRSNKSDSLSFQYLPSNVAPPPAPCRVPQVQDFKANGYNNQGSSRDLSLNDPRQNPYAMDPSYHNPPPPRSDHPSFRSLPPQFSTSIDSDGGPSKPGSVRGRAPRYKQKKPSPHNKNNTAPPNRYEDLFDQTLQRITAPSPATVPGSTGKKQRPGLKKGASLSTHSPSPVYSSNEDSCIDDEELIESDMSPPP
nr:ionotropic glutamate receptor-13 [Pleurobrachia bachei]